MSNKGRSNQSLCEKSMKMVANMVRLSSFSIAQMSLGTAGPPPTTKNLATPVSPPLSQFPRGLRAQKPNSSSKPVTYVTQPIQENGTIRVVHEEKSIDGKASDYITKVHEKIRHDSTEASTLSTFVLLPPPSLPHVLM